MGRIITSSDALEYTKMHLDKAAAKLEKLRVCQQTRNSQVVREQIRDISGSVAAAQRWLAKITEEKK